TPAARAATGRPRCTSGCSRPCSAATTPRAGTSRRPSRTTRRSAPTSGRRGRARRSKGSRAEPPLPSGRIAALRVTVVGRGAIGVTYAAAAEEAGHEVVLCGRRAAPAPVVERPDGTEHRLRSGVIADPADAGGPVPWVLLAVKAHQTEGAAAWLEALCGA